MEKFAYILDDNVAIATMTGGENRFNFNFFNEFHKLLDELEKKEEINSLVVTSAHEKIWSNGIDLEWLSKKTANEGPEFIKAFRKELFGLFIRLVNYPMITYAAINGHAFAGGAIMACAFDYRFMREDRGWFSFPEIDVKIPFTPFLNAVALKAIPLSKLNEMQLCAERLTADECKQFNIVKKVCSLEGLIPDAVEQGKLLSKDREMIKTMKEMLFKDITKLYDQSIGEPEAPLFGNQNYKPSC